MYLLRALTIVVFTNLPCTKYEFLPDKPNKTMACYTFSVRSIIPESKYLKTAMKNINEKENEDFSQGRYFNFEDLTFSGNEIFLYNFWLR